MSLCRVEEQFLKKSDCNYSEAYQVYIDELLHTIKTSVISSFLRTRHRESDATNG